MDKTTEDDYHKCPDCGEVCVCEVGVADGGGLACTHDCGYDRQCFNNDGGGCDSRGDSC